MAPRRKKTRTHVATTATSSTPKSFVVRHGDAGKSVDSLVRDIRTVLEPNTSTRLKERHGSKLMDYISIAGPLGVSHLVVLGRTETAVNLRLARLPHGPTFSFRVMRYSLSADIRQSQRRPVVPTPECSLSPALLVLNAFPDRPEMNLLSTMLQSLFPPIAVGSIPLGAARRLLLVNYDAATATLDWRHFLITVRPSGISKKVRRLPSSRALPDLSATQDVADYLLSAEGFTTSDSEQDTDAEQVELATDFPGRNSRKGDKRAVRLTEIGPRMQLRLAKITTGLAGARKAQGAGNGEGEVLFHQFVQKSKKDVEKQKKEHAQKKAEASKRRLEQEANVARKKALAKAAGEEVSSSDDEAEDQEEENKTAKKLPTKTDSKKKPSKIMEESSDDDEGQDMDEFAYEDGMGDDMDLFDPED